VDVAERAGDLSSGYFHSFKLTQSRNIGILPVRAANILFAVGFSGL
jgi:hypothetical protein